MISNVTNQGRLRFMVHEWALSGAIVIAFLRRLIADAPRKLFVMVDDTRVHQAKVVTAWAAAHAEMIALFHLPGRADGSAPRSPRS